MREIADGLVDAEILVEKPSVELEDIDEEFEGSGEESTAVIDQEEQPSIEI